MKSDNLKIHYLADVMSNDIGENTSIWQFTVVMKGAKIGSNCNIGAHVFIEDKAIIGNMVTIKNGVQIWNHIIIGDGVFIGPNVTFTNDLFPVSNREDKSNKEYPTTIIGDGASIGGGAVILPGINIGADAIIGAGAVVADDVSKGSKVIGPKAKKI